MRAVVARAPGGPEVLEVVDASRPEPGLGEVLVRHAAIGVNFIDVYHRTGLYPGEFPGRLGQEAAGTVEAVGPGVSRFAVGDRIAYATGPRGGYAEFNVVPEGRAVRVPEAVPLELAAASLLKGMTAEFLVRRTFHVKHGHTVLVHAAAGGVGSILTQWARAVGATVIGAVGSEAKADEAGANGCHEVIVYNRENVADRVRAITGGAGVPVVYDGVGAATFDASLASLARRGLLVSFGNASGPVPPVDPLRLSRAGSLYLTRPTLFDYVATTAELDESAAALFDMLASGKVKVHVGRRYRLDQARAAHEALQARQTTGSTILVP